jgi:hypothetical protein
MAVQQTGKQRALRIPLDYFRQPEPFGRWKGRLALLAFLVSAGWCAASYFGWKRGSLDYSRGPVASVHATWENDCEACHRPLHGAISKEAALVPFFGSVHATDEACQECHRGPAHHANQREDLTPSCAGCHRDHRGRDASLVHLPDSDCTQCHADLGAGEGKSPGGFTNSITSFYAHHPEFPSREADPGKLKFNHAVHMAEGMKVNFTLDKVEGASERARYQAGKGGVKLECADCHQLDSSDGQAGARTMDLPVDLVYPSRRSGRYMLPIVYENQCKGCHPLSFPDGNAGVVHVPHRLQPTDLDTFLESYYTAKFLQGQNPLLEHPARPARPFPGKPADTKEQEKARELIRIQVASAKGYLASKSTCTECHADAVAEAKHIASPAVPEVWFKHALFSHAAHRAVRCEDCHSDAAESEKSTQVLIPGREICLKCHAPAGNRTGGARFDCTECHLYHQGDDAGRFPGIGTRMRGVENKDRLTIEEFLRGGRHSEQTQEPVTKEPIP